jgi:hypothetical protein
MEIAKRVYSLAKEQNDPALMMAGNSALAVTLFFMGDFEAARQYAMRGVQIWRSRTIRSPVEDVTTPAVVCLCYEALSEWHLGEISSCKATAAEAVSTAKELNHTHTWPKHYSLKRLSPTTNVSPLKWNAAHRICLSCQRVTILQVGWLQQPFSAVGRAALPVIPLKASRGSRRD